MKNTLRTLFILFLLFSFFSGSAEARWWIFGVAKEEIMMNFLYLNRVSYDELGQKVILYRETLADGEVLINGKASISKGKIASVRVTLNNKVTWEDARLSEDGTFEYRFRPELNKIYVIYIEVMETRGKTNDVEATRKEVTVSERNIMALIKEILDQMVDAYRKEDSSRFMSFVAEDFAGDKTNLDRAIRKDFSLFDNIDLRFTINNVATTAKGLIFVSLNYSRILFSTRTGQSFTDKGITEFVFKLRDIGPRVFSMKNPLIFGLNDAANVATGTTKQPIGETLILVDDQGNVAKVPSAIYEKVVADESLRITVNFDGTATIKTNNINVKVNPQGAIVTACGSGEVESGARQMTIAGHPPSAFRFSTGTVQPGDGDFIATGGDTGKVWVSLASGVSYQDLGAVSLASVTEAPATGYTAPGGPFYLFAGRIYAFKLANGRYGLLAIQNVIAPGFYVIVNFYYKYQPDGSRCF